MTSRPGIEALERRRFLDAGSIDQTFGDGGLAIIRDPSIDRTAVDVVALPDGSVAALSQYRPTADRNPLKSFEVTRLLPDGKIDGTFGDNGSELTDFGGLLPNDHDQTSEASALAAQPDGQIVAAGVVWGWKNQTSPETDYGIAIARYHGNGTFDRKFGKHGRLVLHVPGALDAIQVGDVKVQEDGKILVAAITSDRTTNFLTLVRLLNDGTLDPSFGVGGIAKANDGTGGVVNQMALAADGSIVVVGTNISRSDPDIVPPDPTDAFGWRTRFTADGVVDPTFGLPNEHDFPSDTPTQAFQRDNRVAIGPDGKVTIAVENELLWLLRYNADGSYDKTFSADGQLNTGIDDFPGDLRIEDDGKIVLLGGSGNVARFNADGTVDSSFGTAGKTMISTGSASAYNTTALALSPDGSAVTVGWSGIGSDTVGSTVVARLWSEEGPAAQLSSAVRRIGGTGAGRFTITYRDDEGIDGNTLDDDDVRMVYPDGSVHRGWLVSVLQPGDDPVRVVKYKFAMPGDVWGPEDNGDYVIRLRGRQVADSKGRFSMARTLGVVLVQIPEVPVAIPSMLPRVQSSHRSVIDLLDAPA